MYTITSTFKRTLLFPTISVGACLIQAIASPVYASATLRDLDTVITTESVAADDYYDRGIYFQGQGQLEDALDQFNRAIELDPNSPDYYFSRGLTYTDRGDHTAAQADYSNALELDPTFAAAYYQRGLSRMAIPVSGVTQFAHPTMNRAQRDDVQLAIYDFSMALQHAPEFVAAHYYRGLSHYVMGNESLAWNDYQQAQQLNPLIADQFYRQGFTQLYIGGLER